MFDVGVAAVILVVLGVAGEDWRVGFGACRGDRRNFCGCETPVGAARVEDTGADMAKILLRENQEPATRPRQ